MVPSPAIVIALLIASVTMAQDPSKCTALCDQALAVLPKGDDSITASKCTTLCSKLRRPGGYNDGVGRGFYDTTMVSLALDSQLVASFLPEGLALSPQTVAPPGKHPVVFTFGHQVDVQPVLLEAFDVTYLEYIHAVPFVVINSTTIADAGPFVYSPRLYLDHSFPVLLGWMYGLNKEMARCSASSNTFNISTFITNKPIISVSWLGSSKLSNASSHPAFLPLAASMAQPLIGKGKPGGYWECSHFHWHTDTAHLAPLTGAITVHSTTSGTLTPQKFPFGPLGGADGSFGGFRLVTNWTMSAPYPCSVAPAAPHGPKKKVAVLGGGLGAMSAVWYLTNVPDWTDHFDVTVYQHGWRLGGKTASGRRNLGSGSGDQNLEHGLHVFMGWYDNAFMLCRDVLKTQGKKWQDIFVSADDVTLTDQLSPADRWFRLQFQIPQIIPGEPGEPHIAPSPWALFTGLVRILKKILSSIHTPYGQLQLSSSFSSSITTMAHAAEAAVSIIEQQLAQPEAGRFVTEAARAQLLELLETMQNGLHSKASAPAPGPRETLRSAWEFLDFGISVSRGLMAKNGAGGVSAIDGGFSVLNDYEGLQFMRMNGLKGDNGLMNPITRAGYDLVFGFANGDSTQPSMAAGVCLQGMLNLVAAWHGSFFYKFRTGTADALFVPLYKELSARGVNFKFLHRVQALNPDSADPSTVGTVQLMQQATLKTGAEEYAPLIRLGAGDEAWPSEPLLNQLTEAQQLQQVDLESHYDAWQGVANVTLKKGEDFDQLILGIPPGVHSHITPALMATSDKWKQHVESSAAVATVALQLWMKDDVPSLGWGTSPNGTTLTGYMNPFNTWADMTHLLPTELWPQTKSNTPHSVAYFCGPLDTSSNPTPDWTDHTYAIRQTEKAKDEALQWINESLAFLWPNAMSGGMDSFYNKLADPLDRQGAARFEAQFWRANVDPSELYILSPPTAVRHRVAANDTGFTNMFAAGDWTHNGLDSGCAEAAITGGMLAAQAIGGYPQKLTSYFEQLGPPVKY